MWSIIYALRCYVSTEIARAASGLQQRRRKVRSKYRQLSLPEYPASLHIPDAARPSATYRTTPQCCPVARSGARARPIATVRGSRVETQPWRLGVSDTSARETVALRRNPEGCGNPTVRG